MTHSQKWMKDEAPYLSCEEKPTKLMEKKLEKSVLFLGASNLHQWRFLERRDGEVLFLGLEGFQLNSELVFKKSP